MEEVDLQGQIHEGQDFMTVKKIQQNLVNEVEYYIGELYKNIIMAFKNVQVSMKNLKSLKETDICVDLLQRQRINSQNKQHQRFCDKIEQKDDSKIGQNLFIGSNPGLFYSKHSLFDEVSFNNNKYQKLASIRNLLSIQPSERNIQNRIINENSLQISGETILDITTQNDVIDDKILQQQQCQVQINENIKKQSEEQIIKEQSTYQISQNRLSKHSKYCQMNLTPIKKKRDFIVPVLTNEKSYNKSRISQQQYFHINDKNLTKFFVTQQKRKYVDTFGNQTQSRIKQNDSDFSKSPLKQECIENDKIFRRSHMKKFIKTNRQSSASNPNFKSAHIQKIEQDDFGRLSMTNTKFLIKVLPSEKTKKLFNQSLSTFINHNYQPVTCRKQLRNQTQKQLSDQQIVPICNQTLHKTSFQNLKSNKLSTVIQKEKKIITKNLSCDDIALKNSFKKINENTKKGRKIKLSQIQKQYKSIFLRQKTYKPLMHLKNLNKQNYEQCILPNTLENIIQENEPKQSNQTYSRSSQKQNMSRITSSTKSHQNKYKNLTQMQLEMIKNNNIKRVKKFKKDADSKLSIVTKMGVRVMPD